MKKLKSVEKAWNGRFIKTYLAKYQTEKGEHVYEIASRKDNPDILMKKPKADAVRILPYFFDENGEIKIVLIKEFRYPINKHIYAIPAGLIDRGESPLESAKRELEEEIGATAKNIVQAEPASYSSAGFCDESLICFEAEVEFNSKQHLDSFEDIEICVVDLEALEKMLDSEDFGMQSRLQLRGFFYKQKLQNAEKSAKKLQKI